MLASFTNRWRDLDNQEGLQILGLSLITGIAAVLRFYKLGEWSFWGDEFITVRRAIDGIQSSALGVPLSQLMIQLPLSWFGVSEWSARLVPALVGVITIPILYFPLRRIFNAPIAILASLFLALSPWHIYWSQNARFYTLLLLFYSLGLFYFYLWIENDRPWLLILSLALFGLASLERFIALYFVPVLGAYILVLYVRGTGRPPGLRMRNIALLMLPGIALAVWIFVPYLQDPARFIEEFAWVNQRVNNNPFWLFSGILFYVGIPTVCAGILGGYLLLVQKQRTGLLLAMGALIPMISLIAISPFLYTANRYAFISLTSWMILAAVATWELIQQTKRHGQVLALGMLVILVASYASEDILYYRFQNGNRDNWKQASAWLDQQRLPGETVISSNPDISKYYLSSPENVLGMGALDLAQVEAQTGRVWVIEDLNVRELWPQVSSWIDTHTLTAANFDVSVRARTFRMRIHLYEP